MLYRRKNALTRHNAVTHTRINRAMAVAFLANLRQLHHYVTAAHDAAYRQLFEVDTAYKNIFTEGTDSGITAARIELIYLFRTQQTHLTVPFPSVGITIDAEIFFEDNLINRMLFCTLLFTDTYSLDYTLYACFHTKSPLFPPALLSRCTSVITIALSTALHIS